MPTWLETLGTPAATGVGGIGIGGFIVWILNFVGGRMDKQAQALDTGTQRLIQQLQERTDKLVERVEKVERELADCKKKHAEAEAKAARLEALITLTAPGLKAAFPTDKTMPNDMAVMAANLDGDAA